MRHADNAPAQAETDPARAPSPRTKPSPVVAFFVALALALAGWGVFWLTTRDEAAPEPGSSGGPGVAEGIQLTDEQAIARIKELTAVTIRGIRKRDSSLISRAFTGDSPLAKGIYTNIRQLKRDDVVEQSRVKTLAWEVVSKTNTEVQVRQTRITRFCFLSESGKDVSSGPAAVKEVGVWIMRWQNDQWLIYDNVGEQERVVDKSAAHCS